MKYLIYIWFFSAAALAQQDSVQVTVRNFEGRPNATFLQTLQNQAPSCFTISPSGTEAHFNTYELTQADKDSIYAAAFNGPIVQAAIKTKFNGKSKLYERGYEVELISLLINDSISSEAKKKLLVQRIVADIEYNRDKPVEGKKPCPVQSPGKTGAIEVYKCETISNFAGCLYVIDGILYNSLTEKELQSILSKLGKTNVATIQVIRGNEILKTAFCGRPKDLVLITTQPN